jgi:hypothetical protein
VGTDYDTDAVVRILKVMMGYGNMGVHPRASYTGCLLNGLPLD